MLQKSQETIKTWFEYLKRRITPWNLPIDRVEIVEVKEGKTVHLWHCFAGSPTLYSAFNYYVGAQPLEISGGRRRRNKKFHEFSHHYRMVLGSAIIRVRCSERRNGEVVRGRMVKIFVCFGKGLPKSSISSKLPNEISFSRKVLPCGIFYPQLARLTRGSAGV